MKLAEYAQVLYVLAAQLALLFGDIPLYCCMRTTGGVVGTDCADGGGVLSALAKAVAAPATASENDSRLACGLPLCSPVISGMGGGLS